MDSTKIRDKFFESGIKMRVQRKKIRLRYAPKQNITKYGYRVIYKKSPEIKNIMRNKSIPFEQRLDETYRAGAKILNRIISAAGYTRSGWIPAIKKFYHRNPDSKFKFYGSPENIGGYKMANEFENIPMAIIENKTRTAPIIGKQALTMAFAIQTELLQREILRRIENAK